VDRETDVCGRAIRRKWGYERYTKKAASEDGGAAAGVRIFGKKCPPLMPGGVVYSLHPEEMSGQGLVISKNTRRQSGQIHI
jgi:hypothetical protein